MHYLNYHRSDEEGDRLEQSEVEKANQEVEAVWPLLIYFMETIEDGRWLVYQVQADMARQEVYQRYQ